MIIWMNTFHNVYIISICKIRLNMSMSIRISLPGGAGPALTLCGAGTAQDGLTLGCLGPSNELPKNSLGDTPGC